MSYPNTADLALRKYIRAADATIARLRTALQDAAMALAAVGQQCSEIIPDGVKGELTRILVQAREALDAL